MRWQHPTVYAGLLLAWAALAGWQRHDYGHERELVRDTVRRQADSVKNALVGGIRSHRRLGRFFHDQLQGTLEELVDAEAGATAVDGVGGGVRADSPNRAKQTKAPFRPAASSPPSVTRAGA